MGAVFTGAARAPITAVIILFEMTGEYTIILPLMLAIVIATTISRAVATARSTPPSCCAAAPTSTDQSLARPAGREADRRDAALAAASPGGTRANGTHLARTCASLPGPVTHEREPQAFFATESLAQALRQLVLYGRDGLPVLSADGRQSRAGSPAPAC